MNRVTATSTCWLLQGVVSLAGHRAHGDIDRVALEQLRAALEPYSTANGAIYAEYDAPGAIAGGVAVFAYKPSSGAFFKYNNGSVRMCDSNGRSFQGVVDKPLEPWPEMNPMRRARMLAEIMPQVAMTAALADPKSIDSISRHSDGSFTLLARLESDQPSNSPSASSSQVYEFVVRADGLASSYRILPSMSNPVVLAYALDTPPGFALVDRFAAGTYQLRSFRHVAGEDTPWFDAERLPVHLKMIPGPRSRAELSGSPLQSLGTSVRSTQSGSQGSVDWRWTVFGVVVLAIGVFAWARRRS